MDILYLADFNQVLDPVDIGQEGWRERYYKLKFKAEMDDKEFFETLTRHYAEGLEWVLQYYYQGRVKHKRQTKDSKEK